MMNRLTAVSVALLSAFAFDPAHAAPTCASSTAIDGTPVLICAEPGSVPVSDSRDALQVQVQAGAGITSTNRNTAALDLRGVGQQVSNAGRIENTDTRNNGYAIAVNGANANIVNSGVISSGDRAIEVLGGTGGMRVENTGEILARRQAVRSLEGFENAELINHGLIESRDGRALQLRGDGARVINHGTLIGGEEVVEARGNFYMENYGTVLLRDGIDDEDGVQFASGEIHNWGLIQGSDDGVDIDEGLVRNYATGRIISTGDTGSGVDIDPEFDNGVDPIRPSGPLTIINEGYIEGPRAIGADPAAQSNVDIINSGTLVGRSGAAIELAPGQGDSTLTLTGGSEIFGDVFFGAGNDGVFIDSLGAAGVLSSGVIDGGLGINSVRFVSYALSDLLSFVYEDERVELSFMTAFGKVSGAFRNFSQWDFGVDDARFDTLKLASRFDGSNAVPAPATLPLLLGALGGLCLVGRRRRG